MKGLDLQKYNIAELCEKGAWLTLKYPHSGEDTPAKLLVKGYASPSLKDFDEQYVKSVRDKIKRGTYKEPSETELLEQTLKSVTASIMDWEGILSGGEPIKFNQENCFNVLLNNSWISEQVIEFSSELKNYVKSAE